LGSESPCAPTRRFFVASRKKKGTDCSFGHGKKTGVIKPRKNSGDVAGKKRKNAPGTVFFCHAEGEGVFPVSPRTERPKKKKSAGQPGVHDERKKRVSMHPTPKGNAAPIMPRKKRARVTGVPLQTLAGQEKRKKERPVRWRPKTAESHKW